MPSFKITHLILTLSLCSFNVIQAAPTLDAAALFRNGQTAQGLNKQFSGLKDTDSCSGQEIACISDSIATCVNGKWNVDTGRCSNSQSCFALPSVLRDGIELMCTSRKNAEALIDSTGAKGGITGDGVSSSGDGDEPSPSDSASSTIAATPSDAPSSSLTFPSLTLTSTLPTATSVLSSASRSTDVPTTSALPLSDAPATVCSTDIVPSSTDVPQASVVTVTERVTVTVMPGPMQTTLPPVTRTLSPDELISILSSIMLNHGPSTDAPIPTSTLLAPVGSVSTPLTDIAAPSVITSVPVTSPSASSTNYRSYWPY